GSGRGSVGCACGARGTVRRRSRGDGLGAGAAASRRRRPRDPCRCFLRDMKVYLVGAGPGDPDLLTLKGRKVLARADAVLYDNLANERLLEYAPSGAERIYVGKKRAEHAMSQEEIAALMIDRAR